MIKYTLYLGLNDKNTYKQEISTEQAYKMISNIVNGCTISESIGIYTNLKGVKTLEKTLKIEVIDFENDININDLSNTLGLLFNQESIAVQTEDINSQLLFTKELTAA